MVLAIGSVEDSTQKKWCKGEEQEVDAVEVGFFLDEFLHGCIGEGHPGRALARRVPARCGLRWVSQTLGVLIPLFHREHGAHVFITTPPDHSVQLLSELKLVVPFGGKERPGRNNQFSLPVFGSVRSNSKTAEPHAVEAFETATGTSNAWQAARGLGDVAMLPTA